MASTEAVEVVPLSSSSAQGFHGLHFSCEDSSLKMMAFYLCRVEKEWPGLIMLKRFS